MVAGVKKGGNVLKPRCVSFFMNSGTMGLKSNRRPFYVNPLFLPEYHFFFNS